jgi:hypothetical protein
MISLILIFKAEPDPDLFSMILFGIRIVVPTILLYAILLYIWGKGFREITTRFPFVRKKQRKNH